MSDTASTTFEDTWARKLPISIAWRSFGYVLRNFGSVMKIGFLPLLLVVAVYTLAFIYFPPEMVNVGGQMVPSQQLWLSLAITPINLLAMTMFVVGVHRLAVLNERPLGFFYIRFQREELRYFIVAVVLAVVFIALVAAVTTLTLMVVEFEGAAIPGMSNEMQLGYIIYVALFVLLFWPLIRIILTFPHAAVAGQIDIGVSWRAMRGNFWRFVLISLMVAVLAMIIYIITASIIGIAAFGLTMLLADTTPGAISQEPSTGQLILIAAIPVGLIVILVGFLQAVSVTTLSLCYKALITRNYETTA